MLSASFIGNCDATLSFEGTDSSCNSTVNLYTLSSLLTRILGQKDTVELIKNLKFQISSSSIYAQLSASEDTHLAVLYDGFDHLTLLDGVSIDEEEEDDHLQPPEEN